MIKDRYSGLKDYEARERCYDDHELQGLAAYGLCNGSKDICVECEYYSPPAEDHIVQRLRGNSL